MPAKRTRLVSQLQRKIPLRLWVFLTILLIALLSLLLNVYSLYQSHEGSRVVRVVDGDTIDLKDGRRIRLLGIDAPEIGRCMGADARKKLEDLVLGKRVRLADGLTDDFGRGLANVFVGKTLVNNELVAAGLAKFIYITSPWYDTLKASQQIAKTTRLGIYSEICRNTDPINDCVIKGNVRDKRKTYYTPDCSQYKQVIVDESFGDAWLCSETEAARAGFTRSATCP